MTKYAMTLLAAGLFSTAVLAAPAPKENESKKDKEKIQGTWRGVSAEKEGKPEGNAEKIVFVFDKDSITLMDKGKVAFKGTFKIDTTKSPRTIDFTITESDSDKDRGKTLLGIYELNKDSLKLCVSWPGETERPAAFSTKGQQKRSMVILKSAKP